jgi:GT2 family glycosyltransferase/2-polyprenyl-3-methyl-5-hydroxy-6-metoxy-1,4-benzoquinol methylase
MNNWFTTFKQRLRTLNHKRLANRRPIKQTLQALTLKVKVMNRQRIAQRRAEKQVQRNNYEEWVLRHDTLTPQVVQALADRLGQLKQWPTIAVIMPVYNPKLVWLQAAVESVKAQIYPHWELCIADDASTDPAVQEWLRAEAELEPRIKLCLREKNGHISACSNSALSLVSAEHFTTLDHDDLLRENALLLVAEAIVHWPRASVFYSDEDKLSPEGQRCDPHFKCDWNPELLMSQNYLCHLMVIDTALARRLGGFRIGYEGAQDHDLALRCTQGLKTDEVIHIPHILYHWRQHEGSTAQGVEAKPYANQAGMQAVQDHLDRIGVQGSVSTDPYGWYRIHFKPLSPEPLVSMIIPTRNGLDMLRTCLASILEKTTHTNYEIIIVDNGSDDPETLTYMQTLAANDARVRILRDDGPFNYSAINNRAAKLARGDYLALVNNDVEVITPEWLSEMVCLAAQPGVGAVGARLWYGDMTLQHGGVILGIGGVAGHSHKRIEQHQPGYMGRACLLQSMSAVTGACLVVRKAAFQEVGGLDEASLAVAFNDVDFCLRLRTAGYRNIWTPHAQLFHHESVSRGSDFAPDKRRRFNLELKVMQTRWGDALVFDPAYSPHLTNEHENFGLAGVPRVSLMRPWFERDDSPLPAINPHALRYRAPIDLNNRNTSHTLAFEHVVQSGKQQFNVLEVGCSTGNLGRALKEQGHRVTGIEPQPEAAAEANQHLDEVYCGTVEQFFAEHPDRQFDKMLFGDVIEHLANPELVLQQVRRHLTPDATVTISVPNVAHLSMRAMLLEGRWDYGSLGIMDRTHLKFFTRESLIQMLSRTAFCIERMSATVQSAASVNKAFSMGLNAKSIAWVELLSQDPCDNIFQFIVTVRAAEDEQSAVVANAEWMDGRHEIQLAETPDPAHDKKRLMDSLACVQQDFFRLLQQAGL